MGLKLFGQLAILGAQIAGRILIDTYKQAASSIAKNAMKTSKPSTGMTLDEAFKILNVTKETPKEEMIKRYQTLFERNDRKTGGSFYLQSKVVRARERLGREYEQDAQQKLK